VPSNTKRKKNKIAVCFKTSAKDKGPFETHNVLVGLRIYCTQAAKSFNHSVEKKELTN
jgi:hypothetical protein